MAGPSAIFLYHIKKSKEYEKSTVLAIITILFISFMSAIALSGCTEGQKRGLKNIKSDWTGGIERTAVLMYYNQIFFDLDWKRVWIQGGIFVSEEN